HRILHTDVKALSADWGMHMHGVADQQDPPVAVGCGLPGHVGESGERGGTMDPEIGSVNRDECLAALPQSGFAARLQFPLHQHAPHPAAMLHLAYGMVTDGILTEAPRRLFGHLDLGDHPARRRIRPGEFDTGCLADTTMPSIAADEI